MPSTKKRSTGVCKRINCSRRIFCAELCSKHYTECHADGCSRKGCYRGYCILHWNGSDVEQCSRSECPKPAYSRTLCITHYHQCNMAGCEKRGSYKGGYCLQHAPRDGANALPLCIEKDCHRVMLTKQKCSKHYYQDLNAKRAMTSRPDRDEYPLLQFQVNKSKWDKYDPSLDLSTSGEPEKEAENDKPLEEFDSKTQSLTTTILEV